LKSEKGKKRGEEIILVESVEQLGSVVPQNHQGISKED
jgi:hypothetical protein